MKVWNRSFHRPSSRCWLSSDKGRLEEKWGEKYRGVIRLWRNAWTEFVPS